MVTACLPNGCVESVDQFFWEDWFLSSDPPLLFPETLDSQTSVIPPIVIALTGHVSVFWLASPGSAWSAHAQWRVTRARNDASATNKWGLVSGTRRTRESGSCKRQQQHQSKTKQKTDRKEKKKRKKQQQKSPPPTTRTLMNYSGVCDACLVTEKNDVI